MGVRRDNSHTLLNHLCTGLSIAGANMVEAVGAITGISYCRGLSGRDFDDLRRAVAKASSTLAAYDAAFANGAHRMSNDDFNKLRDALSAPSKSDMVGSTER